MSHSQLEKMPSSFLTGVVETVITIHSPYNWLMRKKKKKSWGEDWHAGRGINHRLCSPAWSCQHHFCKDSISGFQLKLISCYYNQRHEISSEALTSTDGCPSPKVWIPAANRSSQLLQCYRSPPSDMQSNTGAWGSMLWACMKNVFCSFNWTMKI